MSENKRYYWLKLQETFFEDDTIDFIESQKNGEKYVLFYLKLCLKALKYEGKLIRYVGELLMPYDEAGIAKLTKTDIDTVRCSLSLFSKIGLIKRLESGEIYLTQLNELIGSETSAAQRKRIQRIKEKTQLGCDNVTDMSQERHTDIDIDIELYKESETEIETQDYVPSIPFPEIEDEDKSAKAECVVKTKHKFAYSIYTHHHSQIYDELRTKHLIADKPINYNYGLIAKRLKALLSNPYFTEEKILLGITNAKNDSACINNNFSLEQMLTDANMTRLIEERYITPSKSDYQQKRAADFERGNMNTGNRDYTL